MLNVAVPLLCKSPPNRCLALYLQCFACHCGAIPCLCQYRAARCRCQTSQCLSMPAQHSALPIQYLAIWHITPPMHFATLPVNALPLQTRAVQCHRYTLQNLTIPTHSAHYVAGTTLHCHFFAKASRHHSLPTPDTAFLRPCVALPSITILTPSAAHNLALQLPCRHDYAIA